MGQDATPEAAAELPLVTMLRYHLWANLRLLDACATLTPEQLATTAEGTFGPIDRTLYHIFRAEQGYLNDLTDAEPNSPLRPDVALRYDDGFDIELLRTHARKSAEAFMVIAGPSRCWAIRRRRRASRCRRASC